MINLELAKKLKEAGLGWEPQIYDYFESNHGIENVDSLSYLGGQTSHINHWNWCTEKYHLHGLIWLPRLDQLLAEIEKRGLNWNIGNNWQRRDDDKKYCIGLFGATGLYVHGQFYGKTPEDAAAKALLWIYKQEVMPSEN